MLRALFSSQVGDGQGRSPLVAQRRLLPLRRVLHGPWAPLPPLLNLQVQGDGGGGSAAPLAPRVSQRLATGRRAEEVRTFFKNVYSRNTGDDTYAVKNVIDM